MPKRFMRDVPERKAPRDNRVRIAIPQSIEERLRVRMEQDDMRGESLSSYLHHLIKMDTGAYV